jgi:hypothetical protein
MQSIQRLMQHIKSHRTFAYSLLSVSLNTPTLLVHIPLMLSLYPSESAVINNFHEYKGKSSSSAGSCTSGATILCNDHTHTHTHAFIGG